MGIIHLSYRTVGAVIVILLSIYLLSSHVALLQSAPLHTSSVPSEHHPVTFATHPRSLLELESAFNINAGDDVGRLAAEFGHHVNSTTNPTSLHLFSKRDVLSYAYAVCKGRSLWDQIERTYNGQRPLGRVWTQADFDNAWTAHVEQAEYTLPRSPDGGHWDEAFRSFGYGQLPEVHNIYGLQARQDKRFLSNDGRDGYRIPTGGNYGVLYVPDWFAMLAIDVRSPSSVLADSERSPYGVALHPDVIQRRIPAMNRLSDVSWYIWSTSTHFPALLRYIGHDYIANADTNSIIDYILISTFGTPDPYLPWPGLVFPIELDFAKALLATPNSLMVAYMLMDRADILGRRRDVKVHIFRDSRRISNLLWDLGEP
ncbi:MAG: hypothetical protein L6R40_004728 [Gallowayella cf. fulva]|nr:MAG: hypothetical protein L6R40_004728 [Xanthomendoza cf. fulva]